MFQQYSITFTCFFSFNTVLFGILSQALAQSDHLVFHNRTSITTVGPPSEHDKVAKSANFRSEYGEKQAVRKQLSEIDKRHKRSFKDSKFKTCGVDAVWSPSQVLGRSWPQTTSNKKYAKMLIVIDNEMYNLFNRDEDLIESRVKFLIEEANEAFKQINLELSLYDIIYWKDQTHINFDSNSYATLENLIRYLADNVRSGPKGDFTLAHLLTNRTFDGRVQGVAKVGAICYPEQAVGFTTAVGRDAYEVAYTFTHEVGHNVGMEHDNDAQCSCGHWGKNCIMKQFDVSHPLPKTWSDCSLNAAATAESNGKHSCLFKQPERPEDQDPVVTPKAEMEGEPASERVNPTAKQSSTFIVATAVFVISLLATLTIFAVLSVKTRKAREIP